MGNAREQRDLGCWSRRFCRRPTHPGVPTKLRYIAPTKPQSADSPGPKPGTKHQNQRHRSAWIPLGDTDVSPPAKRPLGLSAPKRGLVPRVATSNHADSGGSGPCGVSARCSRNERILRTLAARASRAVNRLWAATPWTRRRPASSRASWAGSFRKPFIPFVALRKRL